MAHADVRAAARAVLLLDHDGDIDEALARAHELAAAHPESAIAHRLVGDLRYAAAIHVAGRNYREEVKQRIACVHLRVARDALITARRLAPDCVDIAAALGDVFCASKLYHLAESEFRRAERVACPSDPAEKNSGYGLYEQVEATPTFPNLARAQYLNAYMNLEFVRSLDASIDRRTFLRRTLTMAERAAQAFPNSTVIASYHARLLFVVRPGRVPRRREGVPPRAQLEAAR
jgi:hypothetical protein